MTESSPTTVADRIERELERLILNGDYAPGTHINENALAARLGVSRAPVREACRLLQRAGLVRIVPNQGAYVQALSLSEVIGLFDVRAALGRLAGHQGAAAIDRTGIAVLRDLIAAMDDAARDADAERYIGLNIDFHAAIYAAGGNERLAILDAQMGKELRLYRRHGLAYGGGLAVSNGEHRALVAAIERGDCAAAGELLEQHIKNGRDRFMRAMTATGQLVLKQTDVKSSRRKA
jgi:DNA-binding GntR family transcriptional regulator